MDGSSTWADNEKKKKTPRKCVKSTYTKNELRENPRPYANIMWRMT
jgi:hypothetical protein